MSVLQIYYRVRQWKKFENLLIFGEVMGKSLVSCFLTHSVDIDNSRASLTINHDSCCPTTYNASLATWRAYTVMAWWMPHLSYAVSYSQQQQKQLWAVFFCVYRFLFSPNIFSYSCFYFGHSFMLPSVDVDFSQVNSYLSASYVSEIKSQQSLKLRLFGWDK